MNWLGVSNPSRRSDVKNVTRLVVFIVGNVCQPIGRSQSATIRVPLKRGQEHLTSWGVDIGPNLDQHVLLGLYVLFEYTDNNSCLHPY